MMVLLLDILFAGTDTTSNTLRYAALCLMTYTEIQGSLQVQLQRNNDKNDPDT